MFGTAVASLELEDGYLGDAASTLVGGEEYAFESHLVGRRQRRYVYCTSFHCSFLFVLVYSLRFIV